MPSGPDLGSPDLADVRRSGQEIRPALVIRHLRSENSGILALRSILIRVGVQVLIESEVEWIELGNLGPLEPTDSCNMGLKREPKPR